MSAVGYRPEGTAALFADAKRRASLARLSRRPRVAAAWEAAALAPEDASLRRNAEELESSTEDRAEGEGRAALLDRPSGPKARG